MSGEEEDLFSRWSRRKQAVKDAEAEPVPPPEAPEETLQDEAVEEIEEEVLARFGLPAPESLGPGDDFSGFMQSGVPEFLRRRALRRLWRSNPVLANLDGLNDYDEDFTSPEETAKILTTAYKVGRGLVVDAESEDDSEEAAAEETREKQVGFEKPDAPTGLTTEPIAQNGGEEVQRAAVEGEKAQETQGDVEETPRPRRMRFNT
ncbi:MAG: DUF3306 domain-containing protein [Paracoccaceae bacterium]|nr:DUF3306 domain-containing protein [Paracoccaceae bacterium]